VAKTENTNALSDADRQWLVDQCLVFVDLLSDTTLHPYQTPFARRIIESLIFEDSATITALFSRQSGKSETVANTVAALMVLLPRLAKVYPDDPILAKFKKGLWVGLFAPVEEQAATLFTRLVDRLTSDHAQSILSDPEIDERAGGKSRLLTLRNCHSYAHMMTANPKAKIESKTFHLVVIDEAQDCDDFVVSKSISPMLASTAGTSVRTGTPNTRKSDFLNVIKFNKRTALTKGGKQNHFEANWREVGKYNPRYLRYVEGELERLTEDSDEFQMSYNLKWMLDKGMFTTEGRMEELGDTSMQELIKSWTRTPVVVGVDPAKTTDSTVVTVVWVDWDRPDEFGLFPHRILNWLDIQGNLEDQYPQIVNFLEPGAHDDFPDSLALACYLTADFSAPEAEMVTSPFFR
jgi:hypothetical protein